MKILNTKFGRQAIAAALILSAMASMSLGAFAAEPSAETAAARLTMQEQTVQTERMSEKANMQDLLIRHF